MSLQSHEKVCTIEQATWRYIPELNMKIWKVAALIALATIPLLLLEKKQRGTKPESGDPDDIFDRELTVD